jgi:hypothetical protein
VVGNASRSVHNVNCISLAIKRIELRIGIWGGAKGQPEEAQQGQHQNQCSQGLVPDDVISASWVYALPRELTEVFGPENDGDDDDRQPVKSPTQRIVIGRGLLIHEITLAPESIVRLVLLAKDQSRRRQPSRRPLYAVAQCLHESLLAQHRPLHVDALHCGNA